MEAVKHDSPTDQLALTDCGGYSRRALFSIQLDRNGISLYQSRFLVFLGIVFFFVWFLPRTEGENDENEYGFHSGAFSLVSPASHRLLPGCSFRAPNFTLSASLESRSLTIRAIDETGGTGIPHRREMLHETEKSHGTTTVL